MCVLQYVYMWVFARVCVYTIVLEIFFTLETKNHNPPNVYEKACLTKT